MERTVEGRGRGKCLLSQGNKLEKIEKGDRDVGRSSPEEDEENK